MYLNLLYVHWCIKKNVPSLQASTTALENANADLEAHKDVHNYKGLEDEKPTETPAPPEDILRSLNRLDTTQLEASLAYIVA